MATHGMKVHAMCTRGEDTWQPKAKCLGLDLHENWLEWRLGVQGRSCMRGSEWAWLELGTENSRCQEG